MLSTLHVLFAPTWLSAMTGYMALSEPMLKLQGANFVAASGLHRCDFVLEDGYRVGLPANACLELPNGDAFNQLQSGQGCDIVAKPGCEAWSARAYLKTYWKWADDGAKVDNVNSTFYAIDRVYHLGPPLLTIRVPDFAVGYDNHTYTTDYLRDNGVCQPRNKYKWGFSFNLTFAWLLTSNILGLSLYPVWLSTFRGGGLADAVFGSEKTVLVVAEAYQDVLGRDAARMSNEELVSARRACHIGVGVSKSSGVDVSLLEVRSKRSMDVAVE